VASAKEAWALELSLRPWRNMPPRMVTLANMSASYVLIFVIALFGIARARKRGFSATDRFMLAMFVVVPLFAFMPQTALWILRSFTNVYPATIEEVRAISFVMLPSLYFALRVFQQIVSEGGRGALPKAALLVAALIAMPMAMKSLSHPVRESILLGMERLRLVDPSNASSVASARSALGIANSTQGRPFYYSTEGAVRWARANIPRGARILTDRDEFVLLRHHEVIGAKQLAAVPPKSGVELPEMAQVFFMTSRAMNSRDIDGIGTLARRFGADYVVVPWEAPGALYADSNYSVLKVSGRRNN
jgi:hypothetical protein